MKVTVDFSKCTGSGNCVGVAPTFFDIGDADQVTLLRSEVAPDELAMVENAVRMCPQAALSLEG